MKNAIQHRPVFCYEKYVSSVYLSDLMVHIISYKRVIHIIPFLFLHGKICCGYSLEAPEHSLIVMSCAGFRIH